MSSMSPLTSLALFQQSRLNIVGNVVLAHFGPLITDGHSVNASVFFSIVADCVAGLPSSSKDNAPSHKAKVKLVS